MNGEPIIIERTVNAPVSKVWKALTENDQLKQWYFDLKEFRPEVGFKFQFTAGAEDKLYVHLCEITHVEFEKKLAYTWQYEGYEGNSLVTFELIPEGGQTKIKLTHVGVNTFPSDLPDFARTNFVAGWTDIIGRILKDYVEKAV